MANDKQDAKFKRAKKRVRQLRGFYRHLTVYLVINCILILFQDRITVILISKEALGNPSFIGSIFWKTYGTSIIWGMVLVIHAFRVFVAKPILGPKWEERQLEKFLREEDRKENRES